LLVTGAGTGVGKTLIAGAIARRLHKTGLRVEVFRPVATGCRRQREGLISSESEFLAACAESRRPLAEVTPVCYAPAVEPNVAGRLRHRGVDLQAIFDAYGRLVGACDCVIVAPTGGLLTPITDDFWTIHLAKMMNLPVVIVARPEAGTVNQTLLTIHAARSAGLSVSGVVMNRYRADPAAATTLAGGLNLPDGSQDDLGYYTSPAEIAERGGVEVLTVVPEDQESSVERATLGFDVEFAISQVDWKRVMGMK
jgi:dethiobiotin synthetase